MSIQFINKDKIRMYLTAMWKKELGTKSDPANGKWYEKGANGSKDGLYGGLTDYAATEIKLDESSKKYIPDFIVCDTAILDNKNGLAPKSTVTLTYTYSNSTTTTHTTNDSIKVGAGLDIKSKASILFIEGEVTVKFSFEYTHSWGESHSTNESKSITFSQSVPIEVPTGKVYKVILTAKSQKMVIPYSALIAISGKTETWFENRVQKHYNWSMSANKAFEKIGLWGLAGNESTSFSAAGITQTGKITAHQTSDFVAKIYDITDSYHLDEHPKASLSSTFSEESTLLEHGILIREIKF